MAGFAVNVKVLEKYPNVWIGKSATNSNVKIGYMETTFLEMLGATKRSVECRSHPEEVSNTLFLLLIVVSILFTLSCIPSIPSSLMPPSHQYTPSFICLPVHTLDLPSGARVAY